MLLLVLREAAAFAAAAATERGGLVPASQLLPKSPPDVCRSFAPTADASSS